MKISKILVIISIIFITFGCEIYRFADYTTYIPAESGECDNFEHEVSGKIKYYSKLGYVKIVSDDEKSKYYVESCEYDYPIFTIFKFRKDRKATRLALEGGGKLYIEYGMFAILRFPRVDSLPCKDKVFYDL